MIAEEIVPRYKLLGLHVFYSMRYDVRAPIILIDTKKITGCELKNFLTLTLCDPPVVLVSSLTTQERGNYCHPAESKLCPLTAFLCLLIAACRKACLGVSGEGYILVTLQPIPYCNPGPYSGHEVKIICQSYRQDVERFALLTFPWRSLIITVYIYTWIHLINTVLVDHQILFPVTAAPHDTNVTRVTRVYMMRMITRRYSSRGYFLRSTRRASNNASRKQ